MKRVDAVQVIYNIFEQYPEHNLFPVAQTLDTAIIVRVPFDEGSLTGKFTKILYFLMGMSDSIISGGIILRL
jgi:aryl-alcohol dehydrogenase-like predicted oxidoreductase